MIRLGTEKFTRNRSTIARFKVFTAVVTRVDVLWGVTPWSDEVGYSNITRCHNPHDVEFTRSFYGSDPVDSSNSQLTSEAMNPFRQFGRTPWAGDRPRKACTYTKQHDTGRKRTYKGVSKSIRTESTTKYTLTTINTHWEAT